MRVAIHREYAVRWAVVDDGVGIFGGGNLIEHLEGLQVEHEDSSLGAGSGETMSRGVDDRSTMGTADARHFAEQFAGVFVYDHHPVLPGNEQTMIRRIGHDIVPASF